MKTLHLAVYCQYGSWTVAGPFEDEVAMRKHSRLHLEDNSIYSERDGSLLSKNTNEHKKMLQFITIEVEDK